MKARPALRGKLVDADTGKPIANVPIVYGTADQNRYIEWSSLPKYADGHHSLTFVQHEILSPTGEFWFAEPESGSRGVIIVLVDGYQRLLLHPRNRELDAPGGELMSPPERESAFQEVIRGDGKLVPNISVSIGGGSADGVDHMYESVRTDAAGRYRYGRLAPGNYRFHGGRYFARGQSRQRRDGNCEPWRRSGTHSHTRQGRNQAYRSTLALSFVGTTPNSKQKPTPMASMNSAV